MIRIFEVRRWGTPRLANAAGGREVEKPERRVYVSVPHCCPNGAFHLLLLHLRRNAQNVYPLTFNRFRASLADKARVGEVMTSRDLQVEEQGRMTWTADFVSFAVSDVERSLRYIQYIRNTAPWHATYSLLQLTDQDTEFYCPTIHFGTRTA